MCSSYVQEFTFLSLRSDWYSGNQTLPRAIRQAVEGTRAFVFVGFPRQWLPVFEWYGVVWRESIPPQKYLPFFSDMSERELCDVIASAKREGVLRALVESTAMLDPIVSDFLYIVDNTVKIHSPAMKNELASLSDDTGGNRKTLLLNGWQSYGRPSIRLLEEAVNKVIPHAKIAAVLPCSFKRPYDQSPTHKKIYPILREQGYCLDRIHRVVITSLGVLPEEVWTLPQVMKYDAGVPDVYRTLRLVRSYFRRANYDSVLDCLQFGPYSDVLSIAEREGIIKQIRKIPVPKKRQFVIRK